MKRYIPAALSHSFPVLILVAVALAVSGAQAEDAPRLTAHLPPHPRLLLAPAEIPRLKEKIARADWAAKAWEAERKRADDWLVRAIELPPRGSQWWHWYACKKDGTRLKTVSPTEHKCPVCGAVYSGWPYDDVVLSTRHSDLASAIRTLGLAYQLTGNRAYADKAREILLAYAEKYRQYPLHNIHGKEAIGGGRVGPQTLDEAVWLIGVCQGADLIWDTLSEDDRQAIAAGLLRPAAEVIRRHKMAIHNIQCWKNSAVGLVGLLLGDEDLVADAVVSPHGFQEQIARGITADGQWYEGAWGYHFYTLSALLPLAEAGERCGLGLYGFNRDGRSLRRLFDGPLELAMPNLVLPAFNDSYTVDLKGQARCYEYALARYADCRYATVLQSGPRRSLDALLVGPAVLPESAAAEHRSHNYPDSGYAILRHSAGPDAAWLCLKYGPHGGGHGHPDKLNLSLYRRGVILGLDPGTASYGVPIQQEWFRTTLAHNTLTVDETSQNPATGACLAFATDARTSISAVLALAGAIYPGVAYRRAVALFGEDLVLVLDLVEADAEHTFDLAWHNAGRWTEPPAGEPVALPKKPGYMHLSNVVRTAGPLPAIQAADKLRVAVTVASVSGETWAGDGFHADPSQRPACIIHRVRGRTAVVGWAMQLDGRPVGLKVSGTPDSGVVEATVGQRRWKLVASPEAAGVRLAAEQGADRLEASAP